MRRDLLLLLLTCITVGLLILHASRSTCSSPSPLNLGEYDAPSSPAGSSWKQQGAAPNKHWYEWNLQPPVGMFGAFTRAKEAAGYHTNQLTEHGRQEMPMSTAIEPTEILLHAAGNTLFRNLYIYNSTLYILTDQPSSLPELRKITSNGAFLNAESTDPTDEDVRVISLRGGASGFGGKVVPWEGTTWMVTEHPEFIAHYYHFTAEILLSLQRTQSSLSPSLPPPRRLLFPHCSPSAFRDGPGMNAYLSLSALPSTQLLFSDTFADLAATGKVYKLDRVVLFDRAAAMKGPEHAKSWKLVSEAMSLPVGEGVDWWAPVRDKVVAFAGGSPPSQFVPSLHGQARSGKGTEKQVVTYVSRQGGTRRALRPEDHDRLIQEMEILSREMGFELRVVQMEKMGKEDQILLASRTTVLIGVHGNGLTSLCFLPPHPPHTSLIEIFHPGGWFRDYEITARSLGVRYRAVWNDTGFGWPGFRARDVRGMQGAEIPVHAPYVVGLVRQALTEGLEDVRWPDEE